MTRARILVVDNEFANEIAGMIRDLFEPDWLHHPQLAVEVHEEWSNLGVSDGPHEIAVFDVRDAQNEANGHFHALFYAGKHKASLVIVKTAHSLRSEVQMVLKQAPNIRVAADTNWQETLERHLVEWARSGAVARTLRTLYRHALVALDERRRDDLVRATRTIDAEWFAGARDPARRREKESLLRLLGSQLQVAVGITPSASKTMYLTSVVDLRRDWLAHEPLLYADGQLDLATPISYVCNVVERTAPAPKLDLADVTFVYDPTLASWQAEYDALASVLEMLLDTTAELARPIPYNEFLTRKDLPRSTVLHFAVHGPSAPDAAVDAAQRAALIRAIDRIQPALLVLDSCHGIYTLLASGAGRYPLPVTPLQQLFAAGIESVVTTQFLVDDAAGPPLWTRVFYQALLLSGDAAIAIGIARRELAEQLSQLTEISTMVVSRSDSRLIALDAVADRRRPAGG